MVDSTAPDRCFEPRPPAIDLADVAAGAEALLIVPPFARLDLPHLGVHVLAACAKAAGHEVAVLYAGMLLAREIGEPLYHAVSEAVTPHMFGERIFARAAYGVPLLGRRSEARLAGVRVQVGDGPSGPVILDEARLRHLAEHVEGWVDRLAAAVAALGCRVVGCTTVFEQTAAAVALLSRVKALDPAVVTILGGANCAGAMGEGILRSSPAVDYVFSGECEEALPDFLAELRRGERPARRVVDGGMRLDLDALAPPDYEAYYRQWRRYLSEDRLPADRLLLPYETSRGCWWGQKHHCTFCAVYAMRYRQKSPDRVLADLKVLVEKHPSRRVHNVDDLMPHTYFKTLIPRLAGELPGVSMFFNQKSNLTLDKVRGLRDAGVTVIQAGVEALSSSLLQRMDKGVLARQNVALLRYTRSARIRFVWSLLYGFPGDSAEDYAHYPGLLPLLRHLSPPQGFARLHLLRFSPHVMAPEKYGVRALRPSPAYADILPEGADIEKIAYFFDAEFTSVATEEPDLMALIDGEVEAWRASWLRPDRRLPELEIRALQPGVYLLTDTRGLPGTDEFQPISRRQATAALVGRPRSAYGDLAAEIDWAISRKCGVELDGGYVPLATAPLDLLAQIEKEHAPTRLHVVDGAEIP